MSGHLVLAVGLPRGRLEARGRHGALEMGLSERVVHLLVVEMTLDKTFGNWYHFIKPTITLRIY
jgi:hypothetical protein